MISVLTREEILEAEKLTFQAISAKQLMEKAGKLCFDQIQVLGKKFLILAGFGNNGGDGFVIAQHLLASGLDVQVCYVPAENTSPLMEEQKTKFQAMGGKLLLMDSMKKLNTALQNSTVDVFVDALFGIGLTRPLQGLHLEITQGCKQWTQNQKNTIKVAIDVPSGLEIDTGQDHGAVLCADITLSFSFYKRGFFLGKGLEACGKLHCLDLGLIEPTKSLIKMVEKKDLDFNFKSEVFHKGQKGHALILAGSREKSGAAVLSSLACHKSNVGLTTLAIPEDAHDIIKAQLIDVMSESLPLDQTKLKDKITSIVQKKNAVLVGPGLPDTSWTDEVLKVLFQCVKVPLVIDATALHSLKRILPFTHESDLIVTPHPGEMAMLLDTTVQDVQTNRFEKAKALAMEIKIWVVLKGKYTLIASPQGKIWINPTGDQTLSVGGTGDVLAGLMVSFLAQGFETQQAIVQSVWMHGEIAQTRGLATKGRAIMASELLPEIERFFV